MEYKASVTVFFSLTALMIAALLFSLIEVVHFKILDENVSVVSKIGTESAFAQYNRVLWDDYRILAIDAGYGKGYLDIARFEERVSEYLNDNLNPEGQGVSFTRSFPSQVSLSEYGILTDGGGAAYIKEAAKHGILGMTDTFLTQWKGIADSTSESMTESSKVDEYLENSKESIDSATANQSPSESGAAPEGIPIEENPVETAMSWKSRAILSQVLKNPESVSQRVLQRSDLPSKRALETGNSPHSLDVSITDKLLCGLYTKAYFSNYRRVKERNGLLYEWEYVINGKETDVKNLEATVTKLIGFREAQNLIAVSTDPGKVSIAAGIAATICILTPYLIEPVKWGVMAAWAYLESVLDVRLLLQGGKVPFLKNTAQWTSNIMMFPSYFDASITARDTSIGLSYEDYLMLLTITLSNKNLGLRSLDILENALNANEDYVGSRIDNFIFCGKLEYTYNSNPVFASVIPMLAGKLDAYEFKRTEEMSYI